MKNTLWIAASFIACLTLQALPSHAQLDPLENTSTRSRWDDEKKKDDDKTSDYCSGYHCGKQDDDNTKNPSTHELENSFQHQGTKKGSISGMVVDQLQPR